MGMNGDARFGELFQVLTVRRNPVEIPFSFHFPGGGKQRWVPLPIEPVRPPPSAKGVHRERHRDGTEHHRNRHERERGERHERERGVGERERGEEEEEEEEEGATTVTSGREGSTAAETSGSRNGTGSTGSATCTDRIGAALDARTGTGTTLRPATQTTRPATMVTTMARRQRGGTATRTLGRAGEGGGAGTGGCRGPGGPMVREGRAINVCFLVLYFFNPSYFRTLFVGWRTFSPEVSCLVRVVPSP